MRRLETAAVVVAMALAAAACGRDDEPGLGAIETPTFPADGGAAVATTTATSTVSDNEAPAGERPEETSTTAARDDAGTASATTSTSQVPVESVSFDDAVGDATPGVGAGTPPAWTDLAGATLERRDGTYRLAIRLGGERAPARSDGGSTMNIASFYDVDGDGSVDHEIWVNLDADGWGAASFDGDGGAFGEDSGVTVTVEEDAVVLLFPDATLGSPDRFRFALASEYGDPATMGSSFARRDDAPDDDRSVAFPG